MARHVYPCAYSRDNLGCAALTDKHERIDELIAVIDGLEAERRHYRDALRAAQRRLSALKRAMGSNIPVGASAALTCVEEGLAAREATGKDGG